MTTGVNVVKAKSEVEIRHVLDERSKALIKQYRKTIEKLISEHDTKREHLTKICNEKEEMILWMKQNIQLLQSELHETTTKSFESGR